MSREFGEKRERRQSFFGFKQPPRRSKSRKFPVFSLMIREFDCREQFAPDSVIRSLISARIHFLLCLPAPVTGTACISFGSRLSMTVTVAGYFIASVGVNSTVATQLPAFIPFAFGSRVSTH